MHACQNKTRPILYHDSLLTLNKKGRLVPKRAWTVGPRQIGFSLIQADRLWPDEAMLEGQLGCVPILRTSKHVALGAELAVNHPRTSTQVRLVLGCALSDLVALKALGTEKERQHEQKPWLEPRGALTGFTHHSSAYGLPSSRSAPPALAN
jgi:hypothetical protein